MCNILNILWITEWDHIELSMPPKSQMSTFQVSPIFKMLKTKNRAAIKFTLQFNSIHNTSNTEVLVQEEAVFQKWDTSKRCFHGTLFAVTWAWNA